MTGSHLPPLRDFVPPILWRAWRGLRQKPTKPGTTNYGRQQTAAYYEAQFAAESILQVHYTRAHKYPLYAVVSDKLRAWHAESILDVGCGPGQMACLLRDQGMTRYLGVDISSARIEQARRICPEFTFVVADIFATDLVETHTYNTFLATEFLEHVEDDISLLQRIPQGVKVLFSTPNFAHESHVRHFECASSIVHRYRGCLSRMEITTLRISPEGRKFFVIQGIR